ncbi:amidohydrolase [Patiriisocius marinistellae]|uniref:Amidohydrolase n=1 Tax=Patiriisocius marinistellae TaxID=2494560 RepID=A0A5J4FX65_9FLAO|nr:amidohydrolase family protein [Patiriisocius marinistellae]GEQ85908.1 amidohydrolase [Patiriisocius marinistellae]
MKSLLFLVVSVFAFSVTSAQNFVIKNVTVFDGEKLIEKTSVLVENGMIVRVAPKINSNSEVIDGNGKFLMPALTNSHVHAFSALSLNEAASAGVLQVFDMHGMEPYQRQMQETFKDSTNYADFYYAGSAATAPGGHGTQFGFPAPTLTMVAEATDFIDKRIEAGASYIKIIVEPWKETLSHYVVKELIEVAHRKDKIAVVHVSKLDDAYQVLSNGADGLVHVWWDLPITQEEIEVLKSKNEFFVIPTLLTSHLALEAIRKSSPTNNFMTNEAITAEAKKLYDAGIPLLAGTDPPNAQINYGTDLYREMVLFSKAGIPNIEVLKTATSNPSKYFGLKDMGYIKEGFKANMLLLDESPIDKMDNMKTITTIWKMGKEVDRN